MTNLNWLQAIFSLYFNHLIKNQDYQLRLKKLCLRGETKVYVENHLPACSCTFLDSEGTPNIQDLYQLWSVLVLTEDLDLNAASSERKEYFELLNCKNYLPWSCLWRPICRLPSSVHTVFPVKRNTEVWNLSHDPLSIKYKNEKKKKKEWMVNSLRKQRKARFTFFFWLRCACEILVPWPVIEPMTPALGAQSLNHWTQQGHPPNWGLFLIRKLTLSQRSQISFMPSATGMRSLMLNFWPEIFTSGVTSHPVVKKLLKWLNLHLRNPKPIQAVPILWHLNMLIFL